MTNENGIFDTPPYITISAINQAITYDLIGLSFIFDKLDNDYASEIVIERYASGSLIGTDTLTNTKVNFAGEVNLIGFHELKIYFTKMNKPYRRLRLTKLILGLSMLYTSDDIIEANYSKSVDPLSREASNTMFEFKIDNFDTKYNGDNPSTLNRYLQDMQEINVNFYHEITPNHYEKIHSGKLYLTGTPTVDKNEAKFKATGLLEFMQDTYYRAYDVSGISYYALLEDIFQQMVLSADIGSVQYNIDSSLSGKICTIPIPVLSARELVQLICNATNMVCIEDRDGVINIVPNNVVPVDYKMSLDEQLELPKLSTLPKVKNINVTSYKSAVASATSTIVEETHDDMVIGVEQELFVNYSKPVKDGSASITGGTIVSATYYAYGCKLKINPSATTVKITVTGYEIELTNAITTLSVNPVGEDCDIDNPLICDTTMALAVANQFKTYLEYRNTYTSKNRGELVLDINDVIKLQTQFSEEINAMIVSNKIKYNGTISAEMEFKSLVGGA